MWPSERYCSEILVQENSFQRVVCKKAAILSRAQFIRTALFIPESIATYAMGLIMEQVTLKQIVASFWQKQIKVYRSHRDVADTVVKFTN